ncbi:MAG: diglucosylglycerate octanoyltransferase [Gordonia sp. (in: high G+C Gram-positive bacteria)]|uniref:diglucosylglycerate octanoyltransferase n=1 Tax=Gordonia sp. (in: high G+C Gram-positive bacteria) TaxID=84139 RepID=UPI003BB526A3
MGADDAGTVVVLADSLSFYGPVGGLAADDERIWPNRVGAALGRRVELFARIGWTSRDIWWALTQDPRIWAALPEADVVILAYGGMDSLPSPLPTALREQIRYLRPASLRQGVRGVYGWLQPRLSRLGWPMALPPAITVDYYEKVRAAISHLRPDLPIVVALPPTHASPYYGHAHPGRVPTSSAIEHWAAQHDLPVVDFYPITARDFGVDGSGDAQDMNPDGIHWGLHTHAALAELVAPAVDSLLD